MIDFGREICGDLAAAERREWLVTNGVGGYASGTVVGLPTRRYHGLLIAALQPPLGRTLLLSKLNVNLAAPLELTAALLRAGKIAPGGSLVFISSLSRLLSYPGATVYAASKDGLASYARSLAVALAPQGIHVLTVYPGSTRTAHARRYSPDNSREARRMPPEVLASTVVRAVQRRQRVLIPGAGNKLFAAIGRWVPSLAEWVMKKTLWEKLAAEERPAH